MLFEHCHRDVVVLHVQRESRLAAWTGQKSVAAKDIALGGEQCGQEAIEFRRAFLQLHHDQVTDGGWNGVFEEQVFDRFWIAHDDAHDRRVGTILNCQSQNIHAPLIEKFYDVEQGTYLIGQEDRELRDARAAGFLRSLRHRLLVGAHETITRRVTFDLFDLDVVRSAEVWGKANRSGRTLLVWIFDLDFHSRFIVGG